MSTPKNKKISRKSMRSMSLFESGESNNLVSLKSLKEYIKINAITNKAREDYSFIYVEVDGHYHLKIYLR